jgi:hypothetical protein
MYITFQVKDISTNIEHIAVKVETDYEVCDVYFDAKSLLGIMNVRWNKCGRLRYKNRYKILNREEYFKYKWY